MVSAENRTGLYVSFPLYFTILVCASVWAYRRMERMKTSGTTDAISAHFLSGRSLGPLITAGTMFASLFSGYTVIGVPTEAFGRGWISFRWMASGSGILVGYLGTGLRLRKASLIRNHQSPVDFITDRFQSQLLRYTIVFLQAVPSVIYLAAQVIAIKSTFNALFELDADNAIPVIIIFALILVFEWVGGLSSVAFSDAIQGMVMVTAFLLVPVVIKANFGGWTELDWETFPVPTFYQNPTVSDQWNFWNFAMINVGFFSLPHLLQRTYAAQNLASLKFGYAALSIAPWFTFFVGTFIGTMGVQILADAGVEDPASPFTAILEQVMNSGSVSRVVGTVAFTSALAAIMSTADSLVIAISQLITVEIIYPMKPDATPAFVHRVGKVVSLVAVSFALLIGIAWDSGIGDLGAIQFSVSAMTVPTFFIGLFATSKSDVHPWTLVAGAMSGTVMVIGLYFGYLRGNSDALPMHAGIMGLLTHLVITFVCEMGRRILFVQEDESTEAILKSEDGFVKTEGDKTVPLVFPQRPGWDVPALSRFGDTPLTPKLLWKSMAGVAEPLTNPWFAFLIFILITLMTPILPTNVPTLGSLGQLMHDPGTVGEIPHWAFKIIVLSIIPTIIFLIMVWQMPNDFPSNDRAKIAAEGIDPDIVELTREEMGRRASYDERNTAAQDRRASIRKSMEELALVSVSLVTPEAALEDEQRRRLSSIVLGLDVSEAIDEDEAIP